MKREIGISQELCEGCQAWLTQGPISIVSSCVEIENGFQAGELRWHALANPTKVIRLIICGAPVSTTMSGF